jgi:hypothetical protein
MTRVRRLKSYIDSTDLLFGIFPAAAIYAAFVTWAPLIVRANRGEEVKEDWRLFASTAAAMSAFTLISGTRVREARAVRGAAIEVRELVRVATEDAERRDRRAAEQQDRLAWLTRWLVALAALTLAAAVVTLVVAIIGV